MRRTALAACCLFAAFPALAQELPKGPKAPPPEPLPDAPCDTARADSGDWLLGRWVAPYSKWEFARAGNGMVWHLDQKPELNRDLGYKDGASLDGPVEQVTGCTLRLIARQGEEVAFVFEGVRTEDGKIWGYANNGKGQTARWTLRRMK